MECNTSLSSKFSKKLRSTLKNLTFGPFLQKNVVLPFIKNHKIGRNFILFKSMQKKNGSLD